MRMEKPKLLIVDDEADLRTQMKWALSKDYEVHQAGDRHEALEVFLAERPALVTLDLGLPPQAGSVEEGFALLSHLIGEDPQVKVVVITGREEREHARSAVAQGAYDFFQKPIEVEELRVVLKRALHVHALERENRELQRRLGEGAFEGMLGTSPQIQDVFATMRKVATSDVPVLVVGESGTGKELVARAIHRMGDRAEGPFLAINCGAIPENLLESELFGHEKGAFTGAHIQRRGRIESAHHGSLFLDEIGELPLALQVKLLRFLQERRIERVGGRQEIAVDTRLMAATNADLKQAMKEGRFREDLYYRVSVVVVSLPPLRDRAGDIPLLARAFLERFAAEARKKVSGFSREALRALEAHDWPGNVRELENRVRRSVVMAEGAMVTPADLELELASLAGRHAGGGLKAARDALEREAIERALARNKGNISRTASELGVSRPTLYELIERLGVRRA